MMSFGFRLTYHAFVIFHVINLVVLACTYICFILFILMTHESAYRLPVVNKYRSIYLSCMLDRYRYFIDINKKDLFVLAIYAHLYTIWLVW